MADQKLLVDCSLPVTDEEHAAMVELTATEQKRREKDAKTSAGRVTRAGVAADLIEQAETLDDVKTVLVNLLRGG